MLGCVLVLRVVAAAYMPTHFTKAQMHPGIAHLEALFAAFCSGLDILYLIEMRTLRCHRKPPVILNDNRCVVSQPVHSFANNFSLLIFHAEQPRQNSHRSDVLVGMSQAEIHQTLALCPARISLDQSHSLRMSRPFVEKNCA